MKANQKGGPAGLSRSEVQSGDFDRGPIWVELSRSLATRMIAAAERARSSRAKVLGRGRESREEGDLGRLIDSAHELAEQARELANALEQSASRQDEQGRARHLTQWYALQVRASVLIEDLAALSASADGGPPPR
jgi:hypothetical protein